jgi:hypothetical protein
MSEERLSDELAAIEAALCSLTPTPSGIQRDRLMFLAGKASVNRKSRYRRRIAALLWPIATAASLLAATTFGILWAAGNHARFVEPTAGIFVAGSPMTIDLPADTSPPSPWANRRLCQLVLEKGIDALPESSSRCVSGLPLVPREESYRSLLKQFLDNPTS